MEIILKEKMYKSGKITGRVYDEYLELSEKMTKRQEDEKRGWNKEDLKTIREFLVNFFGNQFTSDDLYDELEASSIIVYYFAVQKKVEEQVTSKIEKLAKN